MKKGAVEVKNKTHHGIVGKRRSNVNDQLNDAKLSCLKRDDVTMIYLKITYGVIIHLKSHGQNLLL